MHPETEFEFVELYVPDIVDKLISAFLTGTGAPDIIGLERGRFPRVKRGSGRAGAIRPEPPAGDGGTWF